MLLFLIGAAPGNAAGPTITVPSQAGPERLSLEERIRCEWALEEVRWRHREWPSTNPGPKPALDEILTLSDVRARVARYLEQSEQLSRTGWPVTGADLEAETARIAHRTRAPDLLAELALALQGDPVRMSECLARPLLVERRLEVMKSPRAMAAAQHLDSPGLDDAFAGDSPPGDHIEGTCDPRRSPADTSTGASQDNAGGLPLGATASACSQEGWRPLSTVGAPNARHSHSAVWTGNEMIVCSGQTFSGQSTASEGRCSAYEPATDSWRFLGYTEVWGTVTALWTGQEVLLYSPGRPSGTRFNPTSGQWTPMSSTGSPFDGRRLYSAVWTGTEMLIWGGANLETVFDNGFRYNPASDSWTAMASGPAQRYGHATVWSPELGAMIIWSGYFALSYPHGLWNNGALYYPASDRWQGLGSTSLPVQLVGASAIWTGSEMLLWSGQNTAGNESESGAHLDPRTGTWRLMPDSERPSLGATVIWTGTEMVVWGGSHWGIPLQTGARYDPTTGIWTMMKNDGAPAARVGHSAVWAGGLGTMLVWGGSSGWTDFADGASYCLSAPGPTAVLTQAITEGAPDWHFANAQAAFRGGRMWVRTWTPSCLYAQGFSFSPLAILANQDGYLFFSVKKRPVEAWTMWPQGNLNCINSQDGSNTWVPAGQTRPVTIGQVTPEAEVTGDLVVELYHFGLFQNRLIDSVTVPMGTDWSPPEVPVVTDVTSTSSSVTLALRSSDARSGLYGFKVYRGSEQHQVWGDGLEHIFTSDGARTVTLDRLAAGAAYNIIVEAYDAVRNTSVAPTFSVGTAGPNPPPVCNLATSGAYRSNVGRPGGLAVTGTTAFVTDAILDGGFGYWVLKALDVADLNDIKVLGQYGALLDQYSGPVATSGSAVLTRCGMSLDTLCAFSFAGTGPFQLLGSIKAPAAIAEIDTSGGRAFLSLGDKGLAIIDASSPSSMKLLGTISGTAWGAASEGTRLFVASGAALGLRAFDLTDPQHPVLLGAVTFAGGGAKDVAVKGGTAFVAAAAYGLASVDVTNPGLPRVTGQLGGAYYADYVDSDGDLMAAGYTNGRVQVWDVTEPANPLLRGESTGTPDGSPEAVDLTGDKLAFAWYGPSGVSALVFNVGGCGLGAVDLHPDFSWSPDPPFANQRVLFEDKTQGFPTTWSWDFGDGTTSARYRPDHTFAAGGPITVQLTVANGLVTRTVQKTLVLLERPTADFSWSPPSPSLGETVMFTDTSTGSPSRWSWDFGDGSAASGTNPGSMRTQFHAYSRTGPHDVRLEVANNNGSTSLTKRIVVQARRPRQIIRP